MTDQTSAKAAQGAAVALLGGALLAGLGTMLTWISADGGFVVIDRSGLQYAADAKIILILAVLAALGAVGVLTERVVLPQRGWVRNGPIVDALVIGGMLVNAWVQIAHKISDATEAGVTARAGAGLYVTAAGAGLMLIAGFRLRSASPKDQLVFNAPPGWTVSHNFRPSRDWRPPADWPPAPDGWQWWVKKDASEPAAAPWADPASN